MSYLRAMVLISMLFSCSPRSADTKESSNESSDSVSNAKNKNLQEALPGEWRNLSMTVNMKSVNNSGQDSISAVPEGEWETILNIKPIRTIFSQDGTFQSEYRNLSDSVIFVSAGTWTVTGDTLSMTESGSTNHYFIRIANGKAEFTGYIDWDGDGESDDLYVGIQKRF